MQKSILVIGAFDTKGPEYQFALEAIRKRGHQVLTMNTGVLGTTDLFSIDIPAEGVATAGGMDLASLQKAGDRGAAMAVMAKGATVRVRQLFEEGKIAGIFGMGGTGGTAVITTAMRGLPVGFPKVCVSTAASGDTSSYIGTRDIVLFPSIVDVSGLNRISRVVFSRAVGAICGMVESEILSDNSDRPLVGASMFGNTTECVNHCREILDNQGYEVLVFHAVGSGGRTLEDLAIQGELKGVLDITTTEWADEICGGIFSAGKERLSGPGQAGIPHLIVPGCIDMVNFGGLETVPAPYRNRNLYAWNPNVTLMRTTAEENAKMGRIFAEKANQAQGPIGFLIPNKGFSILDSLHADGTPQRFWDPEADQAFVDSLHKHLHKTIPISEMEVNINDPKFAKHAVRLLMGMME